MAAHTYISIRGQPYARRGPKFFGALPHSTMPKRHDEKSCVHANAPMPKRHDEKSCVHANAAMPKRHDEKSCVHANAAIAMCSNALFTLAQRCF